MALITQLTLMKFHFEMSFIGAFKEAFKKAKSAIMEPINTVEVCSSRQLHWGCMVI